MDWKDWIKTQGERLTIRNYEDMTLSHVSFDAGYKFAIEKAAKWFADYLMEIGYTDDWMRDSPNMKSGEERFIKAMEE